MLSLKQQQTKWFRSILFCLCFLWLLFPIFNVQMHKCMPNYLLNWTIWSVQKKKNNKNKNLADADDWVYEFCEQISTNNRLSVGTSGKMFALTQFLGRRGEMWMKEQETLIHFAQQVDELKFHVHCSLFTRTAPPPQQAPYSQFEWHAM